MKGENQALSERPLADIMRDERSQEFAGRGKEEVSKKKPRWRDPAPPIIERPFRARKTIERFGSGLEVESSKEVRILKGRGLVLKDIPNVAHKFAKISRTDDILVLLHTLLYGKRAKVNQLKSNVLNFSGYVWLENKEKEQKKVKERLERFTREGLYQLIDLLDLQISKSSSKKEDLIEEVFKFLLAPKATRNLIIGKPEQKSKEEPLKDKERKYKPKTVSEGAAQRKVPKGKDAGKQEGKIKPSESVKPSGKRRKSQVEETGEELKKSAKRAKKSRDTSGEKEEQKDDVVGDETLAEEVEQREEEKHSDAAQDEGSKGGEDSKEDVVMVKPTDATQDGGGKGKEAIEDVIVEKPTDSAKEEKPAVANRDEGGRGDEASKEDMGEGTDAVQFEAGREYEASKVAVTIKYRPDEEKAEGTDGEAQKGEPGERRIGVIVDSNLPKREASEGTKNVPIGSVIAVEKDGEAIVDSNLLEKGAPVDIKAAPMESIIAMEEDGNQIIDESIHALKSDGEHLGDIEKDFQDKDKERDKGSCTQCSREEYKDGILESSNGKVMAAVVPQQVNEKVLEGHGLSSFVPEQDLSHSAGDISDSILSEV